MLTKQQINPYIWDSTIKIRTKKGTYEKEDKSKQLIKIRKENENGKRYTINSRNINK